MPVSLQPFQPWCFPLTLKRLCCKHKGFSCEKAAWGHKCPGNWWGKHHPHRTTESLRTALDTGVLSPNHITTSASPALFPSQIWVFHSQGRLAPRLPKQTSQEAKSAIQVQRLRVYMLSCFSHLNLKRYMWHLQTWFPNLFTWTYPLLK